MPFFSTKSQVLGWWWIDKAILNPHISGNSVVPMHSAIDVSNQLKLQLLNCKANFFSEDGSKVDYKRMSESKEFLDLSEISKSLGAITLSDASLPVKKSFFINTYNVLAVFGLCRYCIEGKHLNADSLWDRLQFYAKMSFVIDNAAFCLNDIENGILRGNQQSPVPFTGLPFSNKQDPRLQHVLPCDPRIHFALNCGANSCPPIAVYSSVESELEYQLQLATEVYLEANTKVDIKNRSITISQLFKWYAVDFGKTNSAILSWIVNHLPEGEVKQQIQQLLGQNCVLPKIMYASYDWSQNSV